MKQTKISKFFLIAFLICIVFGLIFFLTDILNRNNPTSPTNQEKIAKGSEKKIENTNIVFVDDEENVPFSEGDEISHDEETEHGDFTVKTIFDTGQNTKNLSNYTFSNPTIITEFSLSTPSSKLSSARGGHIFIHAFDTQLQHFNPKTLTFKPLVSDVTKIKTSDNGDYLLFEQKQKDGFRVYHYAFNQEDEEITELSSSYKPLLDFGRIYDFYYFKTQENPLEYFYLPGPKADSSNSFIGLQSIKGYNALASIGDSLVAYSKQDHSIYLGPFGGELKKQFAIPMSKNEFLVDLKVSPFHPKSVNYIALLSFFEDDTVGSKVVVNNEEIPELQMITHTEWLTRDLILFVNASTQNDLYVYNTSTKSKHLLASDISSVAFDKITSEIIFTTPDEKTLRKIKVSK